MQSVWFSLALAMGEQVKAVAQARSVAFMDNPPLPLALATGVKAGLFVLARGDTLVDQPGIERERRRLRLVLGAVVADKDRATERAAADELHFAARDRLKSLSCRQALLTAGGPHDLREVDIEPELKEIAAVGTVLLSAYEMEYFQTYPSFNA